MSDQRSSNNLGKRTFLSQVQNVLLLNGEHGARRMGEWLMCVPKIYMNASQYEEVKDGGRGVRGHAETKPKMAFSPFWLEG